MSQGLLPYFGVFHLTVKDAAKLVVEDMLRCTNLIQIEEPKDWDGDVENPKVRKQLEEYSELFEQTLLAEVDIGRLETASASRGFDNRLIADETYIEYDALISWLRERRYYIEDGIGEIIGSWLEDEVKLAERVGEQVKYFRAVKRNALDDKYDPEVIPEAYKMKVMEIIDERDALRAELAIYQAQADNANTGNSRDHVSDKLAILNQTAFKFWGNQNENTRSTHPDNEVIETWLVDRDFSKKEADAATSIIRPSWAPSGRKPGK